MHGEYGRAIGPRIFLILVHLTALCVVAWLLFGGGLESVASWRGTTWAIASPERRWLLIGCAVVYFLRLTVTGLYLLGRKIGWTEAAIVAGWVVFIHILFAYLGGTNPKTLNPAVTAAALILYTSGSFLNTGSELQRKWWKQNPVNEGRLYTQGLFRYAMHINYFGDELLFTGYALVTGSAWAILVPLLMAAGFVFFNIPQLNKHLREHYGSAFQEYARHTKNFVPFLY